MNAFNDVLKKLQDFTKDCRPDMHEPDEQGIFAFCIGERLDNAMGDTGECGEMIVILRNDDGGELKINLADLIALARRPLKMQEEIDHANQN